MSILGLDIGTTGCKAIAFREDGTVLARAAREYSILTPQPNWAEQDAEAVWQKAWECLREAAAAMRADPPRAMALSVQGEAVIPIDREGRALRPAILGMDARTEEENRWLAERFGPEVLFQRTGMPLHTINTLPKLLWLQRHEGGVWKTAEWFSLYEDFFIRRLTGRAAISHCLASRTQMYDLARGAWADDILDACAIPADRLAPLAPVKGGVVGVLRRDLADELGLRSEVIVASGGHDQACAALGSGVIAEGLAMVSTGTAEVVEVALRGGGRDDRSDPTHSPDRSTQHHGDPRPSDILRKGNISIYRHVVPGLYLAMTLNHSGGLLLRWFRDVCCEGEIARARATGEDAYDLILRGAPEGPTGLYVLPHFAGSGTPWLDTASRGAILGLTFADTRPRIAKAILEGLTFELRINLDLLREGGIAIRELYAVGGGARSPLWLQLKADICGLPIGVPAVTEAACLGAALLAGVAAGVWPDLESAVGQTVRLHTRIEPCDNRAIAYAKPWAIYRRIYPTLTRLFRE